VVDRLLALRTAPAWFFLILTSVYLATAHYGGNVVNDVHSAAHAAWSLATRGTLDLSGLELPYDQAWTVQVGDAEYSNRFPGVILSAVPLYAVVRPDDPLVGPSAATGALATAVGVTAVLVALLRLVSHRQAYAAAALLGLGTGVWAVAADGLWTHGIAVMALGLALVGTVVGGWTRVVVVLGAAWAVLTRPHLAVALGVVALALWRRDRGAAVALAAGTALGALAFLLYGRLLLGQWSLTGAYDSSFVDLASANNGDEGPVDNAWWWRLENLGTALIGPRIGILPAYPVLLPALWALIKVRRDLPWTALAWGLGGLTYAVVQLALLRASGGVGFWGNRTLIESVVLIWPLAACAVAAHAGGRLWRVALAVTVAWTVGFHALGAVSPSPAPSNPEASFDPFYWQVPSGLAATSTAASAAVVLLALAAGFVAWTVSRPARAVPTAASPVPVSAAG
jgi:hypothetical protein